MFATTTNVTPLPHSFPPILMIPYAAFAALAVRVLGWERIALSPGYLGRQHQEQLPQLAPYAPSAPPLALAPVLAILQRLISSSGPRGLPPLLGPWTRELASRPLAPRKASCAPVLAALARSPVAKLRQWQGRGTSLPFC